MANMTLSIDPKVKERFTHFCDDVGLSASSLITVFMNTVVRENRIPFIIEGSRVPNPETIAAMEEGERIARDPNARSYTDLAELWKDLAR